MLFRAWSLGNSKEIACAIELQDQTVQAVPREPLLSLWFAMSVRALRGEAVEAAGCQLFR